MVWARRFWHKLQTLFRRDRSAQRLDDEMQFHLDEQIAENLAAGMSREEARCAAQRAFGNTALIKEQTREAWGWLKLEIAVKDVQYGIRGLFRSPLFTFVSVLSLALGVGAITGIFGTFEAVFLNAVSARNVGQLEHIEPGDSNVSYRCLQYLSSANIPTIQGLVAYFESGLSLRLGTEMERITGDIVSPNFFTVLAVTPAMGRAFSEDEQQPGRQPQVAIVSHAFWRRKFAARPDVLGKVIELNAESFTIVGVLPENYRSVDGYGMSPEVYVPLSKELLGDLKDPSLGSLNLIARMQDGVTFSQLKASLVPVVQSWRQMYPGDTRYAGEIRIYPLTGIEKMRRDGIPVELTVFLMLVILVAVLILLIACANVAGLLVARGANRSREIAVRLALGAPRYRVAQQLLTETALLAFLGSCEGIVLYLALATAAARVQILESVPFELHLHLDQPLLYFSIGLVGLTTLLSGLLPALQSSRTRWHLGSNQIGAETYQRFSLRRAVVVGQFALTFVLLVSASLFLRALAKTSHADPGFNVQHLLTVEVALNDTSYSASRSEQYFERAINEISRLQGIRSVSGASTIPLGIEHWAMSMKANDRNLQRVFVNSITPGYFRTMQIPLLKGRDFRPDDRADSPPVAIVNETLANAYSKGDVLGNLVYVPFPGTAGKPPTWSPFKIIGIARDSKYGTLGEEASPALYWPVSQHYGQYSPPTLIVHTASAPASVMPTIRQILVSLEPYAPIKIELMRERLAGALLPSKIAAFLFSGIGALGLLLATIGIYGVVAYSVGRRTAEMGIRMALGATKAHVFRLILKDAGQVACVGIVLGAVLASLIVQTIGPALPAGMPVLDLLSFVTVGCVLTFVGLCAALIPAWRGSRIDPMVALRYE